MTQNSVQYLNPSHWKKPSGYSNGVAATGRLVVTGGIIGWNAQYEFETDDFAQQVDQALRSIVEVLAEAGARPEHIVRMTWYVTSRDEYLASLPAIGDAYRELIGKNFPAMAVVEVVALVEAEAKIEIETIAVVPDAA